jgi:uncharacterized membrane protein
MIKIINAIAGVVKFYIHEKAIQKKSADFAGKRLQPIPVYWHMIPNNNLLGFKK